MIKKYNYNNIKVEILFKDNGRKKNLLCIHGFYSNIYFTGKINDELKNYNIISVNYGQLELLSIDNIIKLFKEIINNLKLDNISILTHSFGSVIALELANSYNVEKIFLVNPFHPYINKQKWYKELKEVANHKTNSTINEKKIKLLHTNYRGKVINKVLDTFTNNNNKWGLVLRKVLTNDNYIQGKLSDNFNKHHEKLIFFISKHDIIVQTSVLEDFIASIGYVPNKVDYDGHNPMKHRNKQILNHLQQNDSLSNDMMIEEII